MFRHVMETLDFLSLLSGDQADSNLPEYSPYIVVNDTELTLCYRRDNNVELDDEDDTAEAMHVTTVPPYSKSHVTFQDEANARRHGIEFWFLDYKWDPITLPVGIVHSCKHTLSLETEAEPAAAKLLKDKLKTDSKAHWVDI